MILNPNFTEKNLENFKINNVRVRFTLIDKNGNVKFDSSNRDLENHIDREEIIEAIEKGEQA